MTVSKSTRLACAAAAAALTVPIAISCKSQSVSHIKGQTLAELKETQTVKAIDYDALYRDRDEFRFTAVIAYESTYSGNTAAVQGGGMGGKQLDRGVHAAYAFRDWLAGDGGKGLFPGGWQPEDGFPALSENVDLRKLYRFVGKAPNVSLPGSTRPVTVRVELIMGPAMVPDMQGGGLAMPQEFQGALVEALRTADVSIYDGHIWTQDTDYVIQNAGQVPPDAITAQIRDQLKAQGGLTKYAIVYIGACHAELVAEQTVVDGLMAGGVEPLFLSHRKLYDYGLFAPHLAYMLTDVLNRRPLERLVLDLTSTMPPPQHGALGIGGAAAGQDGSKPVPMAEELTADQSYERLQAFYAGLSGRQRNDAVEIAAYQLNTGTRNSPF
jgi:hypothetical protein